MPQKKTDESPSSSPLTIQLPGIEDNAKEKNPQKEKQVDILKEISKKLSTLISAVNVIKDDIHDMKEQTVSKTVIPPQENHDQQIGQTLQQIQTYLERINTPQLETTVIQEPSQTNILIEEDALRIKSRISKIWDLNLKARRSSYWQAYRNENIANKYEEWASLDEIILPQWLQMKSIPNEPENLTKRREKQVLDNFKAEIELIRLRRENQEEKYKAIDNKMKEEISKIATGQRRAFLIKLWEEDCNRNNEISQKRWEDKNAAWFVKYEQSFRNIHANKNRFIKIGETAQTPRSYADAVSTPQYQPPTAKQQQQQQPEGARSSRY